MMSQPEISVIICTHNPRVDYLQRTLDALKEQSLLRDRWELLLIDNASAQPLCGRFDLSWHSRARHVKEPELGLTPARLCGIREAKNELLIFVDDDNLLAPDYLATAAGLFCLRPDLGAISGCLLPKYETTPPSWFRPYESWIAVRRVEKSVWSSFPDPQTEPCGAGMCLRREVAQDYAWQARNNSRQKILGRRGNNLLSGEDVVIARTAMKLGYSVGQFAELKSIHLIPTRRVSEQYLFSLYCNLRASGHLIGWLEQADLKPLGRPNWRVVAKAALRFIKGNNIDRRLVQEEFRAHKLAREISRESLASLNKGCPIPQKLQAHV